MNEETNERTALKPVCLSTMPQGREQATQSSNLVHTDVLHIAPQGMSVNTNKNSSNEKRFRFDLVSHKYQYNCPMI